MAPDKRKPGTPANRRRAQTTEASNLNTEHSTAIVLPLRAGWEIVMRRAYAIRRYRGREKSHAVHLWRVAVQDALGVRDGAR